MSKHLRVLLVHGPNLNRLGHRNPAVYGTVSLAEIIAAVTARVRDAGADVVAFQSNHKGALIDWLQENAAGADAIVINPGGLAHYSVALRDALEDTNLPVIEVHISDPAARVIAGKGLAGYLEALGAILKVKSKK